MYEPRRSRLTVNMFLPSAADAFLAAAAAVAFLDETTTHAHLWLRLSALILSVCGAGTIYVVKIGLPAAE